jgi:vitamin B12 transporter
MKKWFISNALFFGGAFLISIASANAQSSSNVTVAVAPNTMDPIIVTATRTPTPAKDVLADYSYISKEEIERAGQTTLVELLQQQKSIQISSSGTGNSASSVFLRGNSNNQTIVLIDGVRSETAYLGGPTWGNIPVALIDHIEVIYGPQSSMYGSDAIGGVIQIFTKKGLEGEHVSASAGYGTYGTSISDASLYGAIKGDHTTHYSIGVSQELSMGYPTVAGSGNNHGPSKSLYASYPGTRTGYSKLGATGQVSQEWASGHELGLQFFQSKLINQFPGADYYYDANGTPVIGQTVGLVGQYSAYSNDQVTDFWKSHIQLSFSHENDQTNQLVSQPYNTKQNIYTWQNDFKVSQDTLQLLLERRTQNVYALSYYDPSGGYGPSNAPIVVSQDRNINSGALAYSLKRGNHLANFSARRDYFTGLGAQNTGNASYGYFLTNSIRTSISYGTGFRAPDLSSLYLPNYGNPNLLPEKSKNTEGGIFYESKTLDANIVVYNNTVQNLISYSSSSPPCTLDQLNSAPNYGCAANTGMSKISGLSLGATTRLEELTLKGSFDQMNPIDQSTGNVLALRARQSGNFDIGYQNKSWQVNMSTTAVGRRYDSSLNALGGYALLNLYSSYALTKEWSLFVRANNILNKYYQLNYGWNPPGSNVFIGARFTSK